MLLRNKKTQGEEQNWCLILNPIKNEIDKKKIVSKMAQVFLLSLEEALDLVANTPIILLDNLTREVASKLRDYFLSTGAEMVLTNDILQKRKCYRTVWPEPPKLTFLLDWQFEKNVQEPAAILEEPSEEIISESPVFSQNSFANKERERLLEEIDRWRRECLSFQEESRRLKEEIEKGVGKAILSQDYSSTAEADRQIKEKEKEIKELRLLYSNAQEKHEMLKEEAREARTLYEEKIAFLNREKQVSAELSARHEVDLKRLKQEQEDSSRLLRENLSRALAEIEQSKLQSRQMIEKMRLLESTKESLEEKLNEQTDLLARAQDKQQAFLRKEQEFEARLKQEKEVREKIEARLAEQEKTLQGNLQVLEARERELENVRRQLREIHQHWEQREAVQRRTQLVNQLADKENLLKKMVKEQEKIEQEIREREEAMRKVLAEQESLEKEIVEARQAQRHLTEQAKRGERNGKFKIAGKEPELEPAPQEKND